MTPGLPPALLLGVLLAAIGTQVAYMIRPGPPNYGLRFGTSALGLLLAEIVGRLGVASQLSLGDLHPLLDLVFLSCAQWLLLRFAPVARRPRSREAEESGPPPFKAELRRGM